MHNSFILSQWGLSEHRGSTARYAYHADPHIVKVLAGQADTDSADRGS